MAHVREKPPLRESTLVTTPSGNRYRWADDEPRPQNVPGGERWSDSMPGGFESFDATLPRNPALDYSDVERLSRVQRFDASGNVIWEGRLERAPRASGDRMAITPSAVGFQAHLEDDKTASMVYIDRDLNAWIGPSTQRRLDLTTRTIDGPTVIPDAATGNPALVYDMSGTFPGANGRNLEALYDAGPGLVGTIMFAGTAQATGGSATWAQIGYLTDDDVYSSFTAIAPDNDAATRALATYSGTPRRCAAIHVGYGAATATDAERKYYVTNVAVIGGHGIAFGGSAPDIGFYDADIIGHALTEWCPLISHTTETLTAGTFLIPHLAFRDPTTVGEIVRQATRFGLRDWAVWEGPTFWLTDPGTGGRRWKARVGPAQLEETGPQVDRLWNGIIVQYQDVDGSSRTVGPVGSGADTEDSALEDADPENPANKVGIRRWDMLTMSTSTTAGATEVGTRFLEQSKLLDTSGRARFVGYVEDEHGVTYPYSAIRSGDQVAFTDAADPSYRRIVHTDKTRDDRTCQVDLDSPPEGLQALLERLGVVLVPLGVS